MTTRTEILIFIALVLIGAVVQGRTEPMDHSTWDVLSRQMGHVLKAGVVVLNALTRAAVDSLCALVATSDPDDPDAAPEANNCCTG
jgi:hypothetical protein